MRCPKCQYVSVDDESRCRNCGFTFAIATRGASGADLDLRPDETVGPLIDLQLRDDPSLASDRERVQAEPLVPPPALIDATSSPPASAADPLSVAPSRPATPVDPIPEAGSELPLFGDVEPVGLPSMSPVPVARPPLAVRRASVTPRLRAGSSSQAGTTTPVQEGGAPGTSQGPALTTPRSREPHREQPNTLYLLPVSSPASSESALSGESAPMGAGVEPVAPRVALEPFLRKRRRSRQTVVVPAESNLAPWGRRLGAALFDVLLLVAIDGTVLWFTAQIVGVPLIGLAQAPLAPLLGFLLTLDFAYAFSLVAVSGQTLGKMLVGIKVVSSTGQQASPAAAALRAILGLASVLLAGLPYLLAFVDESRRALHDRLAGTQVVRS